MLNFISTKSSRDGHLVVFNFSTTVVLTVIFYLVAVNNLVDEEYYFRGIDTSPVGRYPAPGRSYTLDLNYQF